MTEASERLFRRAQRSGLVEVRRRRLGVAARVDDRADDLARVSAAQEPADVAEVVAHPSVEQLAARILVVVLAQRVLRALELALRSGREVPIAVSVSVLHFA